MKYVLSTAIVVLSQPALAQSEVKIYGIADLGIAKSNGGTATTNGGPPVGNKSWHMQQGAVSRLGFRGNEDLGEGLSAQFSLETRFHLDTGATRSASTFWSGHSYVQLTKRDVGSVWMGRNYIPAFYVAVKLDPFGWDGVGQHALQQFALYRGKEGPHAPNILGFKSAKFFNSLTFDLSHSLAEGQGAKETGLNIQYASGNWYAGLGYDQINGGSATMDGNSLVNMGVAYNFGVVRPIIYHAISKTDGGNRTSKTIAIGATAPLGSGTLKAGYLRLKPDGGDKQQKLSLGYDYPLSKLTNIYVDTALAKEENKTNTALFSLGIKKRF